MDLTPISTRRPRTRTSKRQRAAAVTAAVLVLASSTFLVNRVLPGWAYPVCGVVSSAVLIGLARACGLRPDAIGFDRRHLGRSALFGLIGVGFIALVFGTALAVPTLRAVFDDGRIGSPDAARMRWLTLVRIPFGTVLLEEVAFRGVLPALLGGGERWRWHAVLGAAALFGLWHFLPSLALDRNAAVHAAFGGLPTAALSLLAMVAAAGAGVAFSWWRHLGRGLLAPALVHFATNSGGLFLAWLVVTARGG